MRCGSTRWPRRLGGAPPRSAWRVGRRQRPRPHPALGSVAVVVRLGAYACPRHARRRCKLGRKHPEARLKDMGIAEVSAGGPRPIVGLAAMLAVLAFSRDWRARQAARPVTCRPQGAKKPCARRPPPSSLPARTWPRPRPPQTTWPKNLHPGPPARCPKRPPIAVPPASTKPCRPSRITAEGKRPLTSWKEQRRLFQNHRSASGVASKRAASALPLRDTERDQTDTTKRKHIHEASSVGDYLISDPEPEPVSDP